MAAFCETYGSGGWELLLAEHPADALVQHAMAVEAARYQQRRDERLAALTGAEVAKRLRRMFG